MAIEKYYEIPFAEAHAKRRRMINALYKNGYDDDEIIQIIDSLAGTEPPGRERAVKDVMKMLSDGVPKDDVLAHFRRYAERSFLNPGTE